MSWDERKKKILETLLLPCYPGLCIENPCSKPNEGNNTKKQRKCVRGVFLLFGIKKERRGIGFLT